MSRIENKNLISQQMIFPRPILRRIWHVSLRPEKNVLGNFPTSGINLLSSNIGKTRQRAYLQISYDKSLCDTMVFSK